MDLVRLESSFWLRIRVCRRWWSFLEGRRRSKVASKKVIKDHTMKSESGHSTRVVLWWWDTFLTKSLRRESEPYVESPFRLDCRQPREWRTRRRRYFHQLFCHFYRSKQCHPWIRRFSLREYWFHLQLRWHKTEPDVHKIVVISEIHFFSKLKFQQKQCAYLCNHIQG